LAQGEQTPDELEHLIKAGDHLGCSYSEMKQIYSLFSSKTLLLQDGTKIMCLDLRNTGHIHLDVGNLKLGLKDP